MKILPSACADMLRRKTQLTANGFTVKAAMKNSVVSVRFLKAFQWANACFCCVLLLNVHCTQHMLQKRQKASFSAAMPLLLCGHVCVCAPVAYQQITGGKTPCMSAVRTTSKDICLFYARYTTENGIFGGFVVQGEVYASTVSNNLMNGLKHLQLESYFYICVSKMLTVHFRLLWWVFFLSFLVSELRRSYYNPTAQINRPVW